MKNIIKLILFVLVLINSTGCDNLNKKKTPQVKNGYFYDIILNEVREVDTDRYLIEYLINSDYEKENSFKLKNTISHLKLDSCKVYKFFSKEISSENKNIIEQSTEEKKDKEKIIYEFSLPCKFNEGQVLVFNKIKFVSSNTNRVKGGGERVFHFIKNNNKWEISETIQLEDY
ncbi:hypothetical protein [Tenacibaculum mesophilum]|uniref:hypothetical protein n=1 Tax=Tenacibaculum mesophilum TaxID=104268 RepID=UPI0024912551|nr:hypothetical protein [Tenacibaculum mesophilum]